MLAIAFLLFQAAFGLAPFYSQQETVDRVVDGVQHRSYIVIFNEKAPSFGQSIEKLQSWIQVALPEMQPENVQRIYEITENFRGFAIWASNTSISSVLAHEYIKYVEEDSVVRIAAPFTSRADWGQVRSAQKGNRNLATTPANLYNSSYPSGSSDTTTWDWTTAVYNGYRLINTGANAKIWIVDTGVLQSHQEFQSGSRSRVTTSQDYVGTGGTDCNGHGSHCAGSAAGNYRGLATGADIGNVRVLNCQGSGTNANVISGFNYVANNQASGKTNILSASLGGGASTASDDAINNAVNAGVVAVVAAGNDNANACSYSPARAANAITVGATTKDDARASFSNFGTCVDVFAPGQSIHSAWYTSATTYNTISGTSMATPLAAGAIALFASTSSSPVRASAVKTAITNYATRNVITSPGTGSPNLLINANWN